MSEISRNLLSYKAVLPRWLIALLIGGSLVGGMIPLLIDPSVVGIMAETFPRIMAPKPAPAPSLPPHAVGRAPASAEPTLPQDEAKELGVVASRANSNSESSKKVVAFGIMFCSVAVTLSALILFVSVPIFLFSSDEKRVARAGGLVKTTLGFFIGSAGAIIATISFSNVL